MAWDDDTIDDRQPTPDLGERSMLRDTIAEDVTFLHNTGAGRDEIAERLGSNWKSIERQLHRIGRNDVIALTNPDARDNARHARKGQAA